MDFDPENRSSLVKLKVNFVPLGNVVHEYESSLGYIPLHRWQSGMGLLTFGLSLYIEESEISP